jgi:hypothetical protein
VFFHAGSGRTILDMTTSSGVLTTPENPAEFEQNHSRSDREEGAVNAPVENGWKGPVRYRSRTGSSLHCAPWLDLGAVEQWHYGKWSIG